VETLGNLTVCTWKLPYSTTNAHLSLSGRAEIYSIVAEGNYGIAVDNVPMRGSSGTLFHRIDPALLKASYTALHAKLIIMEYGGNLVPGSNARNISWTKKLISRQIQAIRAANPEADILFVGPADMAKKENGTMQTYPSLHQVIQGLREVALENGAAYWDMHRVMGGDGSIIQWVTQNPPLAQKDYIHFSRSGAAHMGNLLFRSLKMHYDYYLFRKAHHITAHKLEEIRSFADSIKTDSAPENKDTLILIDMNTLQRTDSNAQSVEEK
jgi:lysophospholipase L1-like esterase